MPVINDYQFGRMVVDNRAYTKDVIVFPDGAEGNWWRKEGHNLYPEDLPFLRENPPKVLVIGQGKFGFMRISPDMKKLLAELNVEYHAHPTGKAVEVFNDLSRRQPGAVVGAFHLTC